MIKQWWRSKWAKTKPLRQNRMILVVPMISNVFLYENLRLNRIKKSGSSPIPDKILFSHLVIRIFSVLPHCCVLKLRTPLIVETIITSHGYIAYMSLNTKLKARRRTTVSTQCWVCVCRALSLEYYTFMPWNGGHYLPNKGTVYGPVAEISASVQHPRFLRSHVIENYDLNVHNCLHVVVINLMYHCKWINKFVVLLRKSAIGL